MRTASSSTYYQVGGALSETAPSYVNRPHDREFYDALIAGQYCYVLGSVCLGKSSLGGQTVRRLQAQNVACCTIQLPAIGRQLTAEAWYLGIVRQLEKNLALPVNVLHWWREYADLSPMQRLDEFVSELLQTIPQKLVIFIDNAEIIAQLEWQEDFWAWLCYCYERRRSSSEYQRLTFALLGVTPPTQPSLSVYRFWSIASRIELTAFDSHNVEPLAKGLQDHCDSPQAVLDAILDWTGGHPYLTQLLCQLILAAPQIAAGEEALRVEQIVRSQVIENWERSPLAHLRSVCDRLLTSDDNYRLLRRYYCWQEGTVARPDPELQHLGLVVQTAQQFELANRIYQEIFSQSWAREQLISLGAVEQPGRETRTRYPQDLALAETALPPHSGGALLAATEGGSKSWPRESSVAVLPPELRPTRPIRLGLTVVIVSLMAAAGAAVVAQNASQRVEDASREIGELETTKTETEKKLEQISEQLAQKRQENNRLVQARTKLQEEIAEARRDRQQAQQQAREARAARDALEQLNQTERQEQNERR
ncbi:MAG: AAA-like domain-containing protein [Cyanophyceae cyanobacterium]